MTPLLQVIVYFAKIILNFQKNFPTSHENIPLFPTTVKTVSTHSASTHLTVNNYTC